MTSNGLIQIGLYVLVLLALVKPLGWYMASGIDEGTLRELVSRHSENRQWGLLGERRVNVLALNLELDAAPLRGRAR